MPEWCKETSWKDGPLHNVGSLELLLDALQVLVGGGSGLREGLDAKVLCVCVCVCFALRYVRVVLHVTPASRLRHVFPVFASFLDLINAGVFQKEHVLDMLHPLLKRKD